MVAHTTFLTAIAVAIRLTPTAAFAFVPSPPKFGKSPTTTSINSEATSTMTIPAANLVSDERIIPRDVLFGNPERASPMLSPDGNYIAFLAPSIEDEVLNVWVYGTDEDIEKARMITTDKSRGIRQAFWAQDSKTMMYMQDFEGDENFHLWSVDTTQVDAAAKDLTPGENVKASNILTNKRFPDEVLVGTNANNPALFDMYRINLKTGETVLDTKNPGDVLGWGAEDFSFEIREALSKNQEDSSEIVRVRDDSKSEWRTLKIFPYGEEGNLVDFCADDGKTCYMTSSVGRDTTALLKVDLKTGETIEEIFSNEKCDVGSVFLDEDTKEIRSIAYNYARTERLFFDKDLEKDYKILEDASPDGAEISISSMTDDENLWVVSYTRSEGPTEFVLYDRKTKTTKFLFHSQPALLEYKMVPMEDVIIPARDGLDLVAYLTRASSEGPSPLILLVHGGPWARDRWGFNGSAQWFANRGYSTLQVNYRGSTGYGKSFLHKGDKEWGVGDMQHDLTDSVKWAIDQGIADPDNTCIYGGSYGGYACLAGLTFTPDTYKCGVDIVGPSNIKTLLDSIPAYWGPLRNDMLLKIGDVDADAEFNEKISPLFHVDKISKPLLIGQGANDPRVKQAEADQIAFSMHKKGIPVEYVLYPDEGHGFARPDNRIDFNARAEMFLAKHLGGRSEEFVKPKGSTATFPLLEKEK